MKPTPEPIHPASSIAGWLRKGLMWAGLIILAFFVALLDVIIELATSPIGVLIGVIIITIIYFLYYYTP